MISKDACGHHRSVLQDDAPGSLSAADGNGLMMLLVCKSLKVSFSEGRAVFNWSPGRSCWEQTEPFLNFQAH